jgi:hypothetical protein
MVMSSHVIFFGWNRSIPGREQTSALHFDEFVQYLSEMQQSGMIHSFEPVFLTVHGGDLNGFFLIRGESSQLNALQESEAWIAHMTRAGLHLEGAGAVRGVSGDMVMDWMEIWMKNIPT